MPTRPPGLFITGTDTGVGKTRVTCWIARHLSSRGLRVGVCKPAATGAHATHDRWIWPDIDALCGVCSAAVTDDWIGPFRWRLPLAPPIADQLEPALVGLPTAYRPPTIDDYLNVLDRWESNCDLLLVEGIGGLLCPLTCNQTVADLVSAWQRPMVVVARSGLGTLNHTLLTLEAAQQRCLGVSGVLLNNCSDSEPGLADATNREALSNRVGVPVWGPLPHVRSDSSVPSQIAAIDWLRII